MNHTTLASGLRRAAVILCTACAALAFAPAARAQGCDSDLNRDGVVNGADLGALLFAWGPAVPQSPADLDGDGQVGGADLGLLLFGWGACPVATPPWATLVEAQPDPAVVTDPALRAAIAATGLAWRVRDTATQIEMLLVPPGTFQMGELGWAEPVHPVTLTNAFYMGRYEVTQAQWQARMGWNPSYWQGANRPVEQVSWDTIQGFCSATGMRLPTEAEWEYAYRAGTTTAFHTMPGYPNGTNDANLAGLIAWHYYNTCQVDGCGTRDVGLKAANTFGLHDMGGNVWEWVNDWYDTYPSSAQTNPTGPVSASTRVLRGGSWFYFTPPVRSSIRYSDTPGYASYFIGFRVARTP